MAKSKKLNFKSKKTWKNILLVGLACITLFGAIVGLSALFRKSEETTKVINPSYAIGALDHSTGRYIETKTAIYTKDGIECQGLTTKLDFDATIKYQLYFYSEHDEFVHTTGTLDGVFYSTNVPVYAKYVRIVIIPNEDENINFFEKFDYAKQLNVEVNKEQNFKSFGENLFKVDEEIGEDKILSRTDGVTIEESLGAVVSEKFSLNNKYNFLLITAEQEIDRHQFGLYLYDANDGFMSYVSLYDTFDSFYSASTGKYYYTLKISDNVSSMRILDFNNLVPNVYVY